MDDPMPPAPRAASNIPEYAVGEISGAIRRTLEGTFGRVRVRGELTEVKRHGSGHIYLSLKDEGGKICGVIWKSSVPRLGLAPENGVEVVATGRITAYADRSSYQLVIERLDYAGAGALLARIEALRLRLAGEGLFDAGRKRALPRLPGLIGLVTSAQGAVLQDIRTTIARRFARPLLLWAVPVQGEGAAGRIAGAIAGFDALAGALRPDLLIVARGGGSLEDLMAFNEEVVVRAAAACSIPLISAVGHETDTTLIDHVADRRAPTPTAAAELAVPVRTELLADLGHSAARLLGALTHLVARRRLDMHRVERGLPDLPGLTNLARQRLDDRAIRLSQALPVLAGQARSRLALRSARLGGALGAAVAARHMAAARILTRLRVAPLRARLDGAATRLAGTAAHLDAVSYQAVLARGYALVFNAGGRPVGRVAEVGERARLTLRFADGEVAARAENGRQGTLI